MTNNFRDLNRHLWSDRNGRPVARALHAEEKNSESVELSPQERSILWTIHAKYEMPTNVLICAAAKCQDYCFEPTKHLDYLAACCSLWLSLALDGSGYYPYSFQCELKPDADTPRTRYLPSILRVSSSTEALIRKDRYVTFKLPVFLDYREQYLKEPGHAV